MRWQHESIGGCIMGGAIGDALGAAFEGRDAPAPDEIILGPHHFVTDDTQLTLATCEAITAAKWVDPSEIAQALLRWFRAGRLTGLGASTLKALRDLDAGAHWALAGRKGEHAAGNGAAMRIAPLAFCLDAKIDEHQRLIRDVSRITHHSDEAYVGALAVVLAIQTVDGFLRPDFLANVAQYLPDTSVRDRLLEYATSSLDTPLGEAATQFGCSGYVVESIPFALFAANQVGVLGFSGMMQEIIGAGGDTDTNASIAGQVVGSKLGLAGLRGDLVDTVPDRDMITSIATMFAHAIDPVDVRS